MRIFFKVKLQWNIICIQKHNHRNFVNFANPEIFNILFLKQSPICGYLLLLNPKLGLYYPAAV